METAERQAPLLARSDRRVRPVHGAGRAVGRQRLVDGHRAAEQDGELQRVDHLDVGAQACAPLVQERERLAQQKAPRALQVVAADGRVVDTDELPPPLAVYHGQSWEKRLH